MLAIRVFHSRCLLPFLLFATMLLIGTVSRAQSADRVLKAEKMLYMYFSSTLFEDQLREEYGIRAFEMRVKNRIFLGDFSNDVIQKYRQHNYSFDTVGQHLFRLIAQQENQLNLTRMIAPEDERQSTWSTRAINGPCENMDFETGDLTGWEMFEGAVNANPLEIVNANQITTPGNHHTIVTTATDPIAPISTVNPDGGLYSLRLGDSTGAGSRAASIRQTFLVDSSNALFTYSYACVLQDPSGHTIGEKPFFKVNLYDQGGAIIPCGEFEVVAGDGTDSTWISFQGGFYRDWSTTFAPLTSFIGQNVTIEFITGDCSQGGHYGYAYIEAGCSSLELIEPNTLLCNGETVTLTAPPGAASYLWNTGAVSQTIDVSTAGTYTVDVVPLTGAACSITLEAEVTGGNITPMADFTATPDTICPNEQVTFTDVSTVVSGTINRWQWDFGDGSPIDTNQNVIHGYTGSGDYTIELIAASDLCSDTITKLVHVSEFPVADFTTNPVCVGTATQFQDASVSNNAPIVNWEWDFTSNGTIDQSINNSIHGFSVADTFSTTLTVTTIFGCADTATNEVVVNPVPAASFNQTDVCQGSTMFFQEASVISNNGTVISWNWDFGDGIGTTNVQQPSYNYPNNGSYEVLLTVTSDQGCIGTFADTVEVFELPQANFTVTDVCAGNPSMYTDASNSAPQSTINSWDWDFTSDGQIDFSGDAGQFVFPQEGAYTTTLIVSTINGCSDTVANTVIVHPVPVADFSSPDVCEGVFIQFINGSSVSTGSIVQNDWDFGDGNTSNLSDPPYVYVSENVYTVTLQVLSDQGCSNSVSHPISIYPLPMVSASSSTVCEGDATLFNDLSTISTAHTVNTIVSWNWQFGDGDSSLVNNPSHVYDQYGTYSSTLSVISDKGCTGSFLFPTVVNPNPEVSFTSPNPAGCSPWCVEFENLTTIPLGNVQTYLWEFGDQSTSQEVDTVHCYENETQQSAFFDVQLTAVSDKGCAAVYRENAFVEVYPLPIASYEVSPTPLVQVLDEIASFDNLSIGAAELLWDFGDGTFDSTTFHPQHTYPEAGNYQTYLWIENNYGCSSRAEYLLEVKATPLIYAPNAFTPDQDGTNDVFRLEGLNISQIHLQVFNRWGQLLYDQTSINPSWDGNYRGSLSQQDVYVWKATVEFEGTSEKQILRGHVSLLR